MSWFGRFRTGNRFDRGVENFCHPLRRLLGTDDSCRVVAVGPRLEDRRVEIRLRHVGLGIRVGAADMLLVYPNAVVKEAPNAD